jgi:glyoxylase-like metal-dependent hydrolase (beta-lactamase superfamily II)
VEVVVVDPGPALVGHRQALLGAFEEGGSRRVRIVWTHDHPDHTAGTPALVRALDAAGIEVTTQGRSSRAPRRLGPGDRVGSDAGVLEVVATPGHTRDHLAFHWPEGDAVFVGDLLLGEGRTAWVGSYPGCVADYLDSLERVRALGARRLIPAHGPPLEDPEEAIDRFRAHRLRRIREVGEAVAAEPTASAEELARTIYGEDLPQKLLHGAIWSVHGSLDHLGIRPFPAEGPEGEG